MHRMLQVAVGIVLFGALIGWFMPCGLGGRHWFVPLSAPGDRTCSDGTQQDPLLDDACEDSSASCPSASHMPPTQTVLFSLAGSGERGTPLRISQ